VSRQAILWVPVLVLGLLASHHAYGQGTTTDETADLEGWASAELRYKFNKQWMFSAEEQLRLKNDISEVDKYFSQLGVRYNSPRGISLDGGYRWIRQNDTEGKIQGYESERRVHFSTSYGHKLGRFSLGYRVRYQSKQEVASTVSEDPDRHLRFRTRVRYNVPNWKPDPVFAAELYRSVGGAADNEFDKMRLTLGTAWDAWGESKMGVFYRVERELGADEPQTTHILGWKLSYTLARD
jgi:Protein of unknown function (DUF2490)